MAKRDQRRDKQQLESGGEKTYEKLTSQRDFVDMNMLLFRFISRLSDNTDNDIHGKSKKSFF